jgi:pimeloyl-ACP methyl ester carboxylesterase
VSPAFEVLEGEARPALLLVHGWSCDREAMRPVADAFAGHRRVLVDLPGHGASGGGFGSVEAVAEAVAGASDAGAVVVGHSLGALVALEIARRGWARAAVLLDPGPIVPSEAGRASVEGMRAALAAREPREIVEAFARQQFVGPVDEAAVGPLVATMAATRADVAREAWGAMLAYDGAAALAACEAPVLAVVAPKGLNRAADLARLNRRVMTGQVAGSGHMVQLEAMEQVAAMMRRFFALEDLGA